MIANRDDSWRLRCYDPAALVVPKPRKKPSREGVEAALDLAAKKSKQLPHSHRRFGRRIDPVVGVIGPTRSAKRRGHYSRRSRLRGLATINAIPRDDGRECGRLPPTTDLPDSLPPMLLALYRENPRPVDKPLSSRRSSPPGRRRPRLATLARGTSRPARRGVRAVRRCAALACIAYGMSPAQAGLSFVHGSAFGCWGPSAGPC